MQPGPGQGPAPGWYHGDGDPPGTERYWNGGAWMGEPRLIGGVNPGPTPPGGPPGASAKPGQVSQWRPEELAGYGQRFVAAWIDIAAWAIPMFVAFQLTGGFDSEEDFGRGAGIGILAAVLVWLANGWLAPAVTGQSLGKALLGTRLVNDRTGRPPGLGWMALRIVVSWGGWVASCYVYFLADYLIPAFTDDRKRVTDRVVKMSVLRAR